MFASQDVLSTRMRWFESLPSYLSELGLLAPSHCRLFVEPGNGSPESPRLLPLSRSCGDAVGLLEVDEPVRAGGVPFGCVARLRLVDVPDQDAAAVEPESKPVR